MQRLVALELMDDPNVDPIELERNFRDIEVANRWFGGIGPVVNEVFARDATWLLDVGCGSADIPRALLSEARRRGRRLEIVALDRSEAVLGIAHRRTGEEPLMRFVRADGSWLPFPDKAFDIVTCNLSLHHFDPPAAVELMSEMRRVAKGTPLICDLRRSYLGYASALLFARIFGRSSLTQHDAPLSMRRAYTPREALELARMAGWKSPLVKKYPFFRIVLSDGG